MILFSKFNLFAAQTPSSFISQDSFVEFKQPKVSILDPFIKACRSADAVPYYMVMLVPVA